MVPLIGDFDPRIARARSLISPLGRQSTAAAGAAAGSKFADHGKRDISGLVIERYTTYPAEISKRGMIAPTRDCRNDEDESLLSRAQERPFRVVDVPVMDPLRDGHSPAQRSMPLDESGTCRKPFGCGSASAIGRELAGHAEHPGDPPAPGLGSR